MNHPYSQPLPILKECEMIINFEDRLLQDLEAIRQIDGDDDNRVPFDTVLKVVESQLKSLKRDEVQDYENH